MTIKQIGTALLLFAGVMIAIPEPATALVDNESFFTHLHTERAMANVNVTPGRAGPVEITIQLETVDEAPLSAMAVSLTLTGPQTGSEPIKATAVHTADDQWRATMSLPSSGRWSLDLEIKLSEDEGVKITSPILIQ
jgi:periplasmic copper chaperone A